MVLLRVARVESFETLEGDLGRRIELVEEKPATAPITPARSMPEEIRLAHELAQSMFQAMQVHIPLFRMGKRMRTPKIILFLTFHHRFSHLVYPGPPTYDLSPAHDLPPLIGQGF